MKQLIATLLFTCGMFAHAQAQYDNTKINIGDKAPELEFSTPEGKTLKLSDVTKGRVVLLDFWASWCRPCRYANPKVVQLYKDYSSKKIKGAKKGFTIVSVSLDQNKEAWIQAIKADSLVWPYHMSDLGAWSSKAADIYGIQFIPQAFLIGADGKIAAKYMTGPEAATEDLKKLVKE